MVDVTFERGLYGTRFVAGFEGLTFIVIALAFADGDADFDESALRNDSERHDGAALLLCLDEFVDFAAFGQQFAAARLGGFVDLNATRAHDGGVEQPELVIFNRHVCAAQMAVAGAQRFGFGAGECDAHDQTVAELVIVLGAAVHYLFGRGRLFLHDL